MVIWTRLPEVFLEKSRFFKPREARVEHSERQLQSHLRGAEVLPSPLRVVGSIGRRHLYPVYRPSPTQSTRIPRSPALRPLRGGAVLRALGTRGRVPLRV